MDLNTGNDGETERDMIIIRMIFIEKHLTEPNQTKPKWIHQSQSAGELVLLLWYFKGQVRHL